MKNHTLEVQKLAFERRKYGHELLIDAITIDEINLVGERLMLNFYGILLLEKSSGIYEVDSQTIDLEPNTIIFIRPSQVNELTKTQFETGHLVFFEGDFLDEFFKDTNFIYKFNYFHRLQTPSFLKLDTETFAKFNAIAHEIRHEIHHFTPDSEHILRSLVYYILVRMNQIYGRTYGGSQDTVLDPVVLQFLRLLEKDIQHIQTVQEYANQLNISRVHLNNLCQRYFAKTAQQFIREYLLSEIKKEIRYSDKSFAEIAYDYHFSAPSHFSRFFKQMTDLPPLAYREDLSKW